MRKVLGRDIGDLHQGGNAVNISEVKRNLEKTVLCNGAEYILKGCIIRRNTTGRFYYQAELMDTKAKSSLIVTALDKIDERRESVESKNTR